MKAVRSVVISMRLPMDSGKRLKRIANRHGWTPSDASARLVEEGLRRSEFAFIDFRDSPIGRQAYIQGSTLTVWEVMLLVRCYKADVSAVAKHLRWPEAKVQAAINYAAAFPVEIEEALSENEAVGMETLKRMLPQAAEFVAPRTSRG
jgi:uncharacterized protein (DUF433 family)